MSNRTLWRIEGSHNGTPFCAGVITSDPQFTVIKAAPILRQLTGRHIGVALAKDGLSVKAIERWTEKAP